MKSLTDLLNFSNKNIRMGLESGESKYFLRAITTLEMLNEIHPYSSISYATLGSAYAGIKKFKKAIELYDVSLSIDDNKPKDMESIIYTNRGAAFGFLGNENQAYENYKKSLEIDNENTISHYNIGVLEANRQNYFDAISHFYISLNSDDKNVSDMSILNIDISSKNIDHLIGNLGSETNLESNDIEPGLERCNLN